MMSDRDALITAACAYAAAGWAVFPTHTVADGRCSCGRADCTSPGKHPRTKRGFLDATADEDQITAWWLETRRANIGIATGRVSGIVVVDIDPRNGGLDTVGALDLPPTRTVRTGGGGYHFYYACRQAVRTRELAHGVELEADGHYVIAPPSAHASGQRYEWLSDDEIVELPDRLIAAPSAPALTTIRPAASEWVSQLLEAPCQDGQRDSTLTRLSGYLRNRLPEAVSLAIMLAWNRDRCEPPLEDRQVRANLRHKYQRYAGYEEAITSVWTARTLLEADLPDIETVIDGILPVGVTLLAGRPKRGKSWLALQISNDVANGSRSLGLRTRSGEVVYLALEDSPRRLRDRLKRLGATPTDGLGFMTEFAPLDGDGLEALIDILRRGPALVVIDTLARVISGKRDQDRVGEMTELLGPVQRLAQQYGVAVLIIDHHRKMGAEAGDLIDDVMGSTAKTAVADAIWGLYRRSGELAGKLAITGRDIEERELALVFDPLRGLWCVTGDAVAEEQRGNESRVMRLLSETGEIWLTSAIVAREIGIPERTARDVLTRLSDRNAIEKRIERRGTGGKSPFGYRLRLRPVFLEER